MQLVGAPTAEHPCRTVRHGGRASGRGRRARRADHSSRRFWAVRSRYLVPLAAALNLSSIRFLSIRALCDTAHRGHVGRLCWGRRRGQRPDVSPPAKNLDTSFLTALHWVSYTDNTSEDLHATHRSPIRGRSAHAAPDHRDSIDRNSSNITAVSSNTIRIIQKSAITDVEAALNCIIEQLELTLHQSQRRPGRVSSPPQEI